MARLPLYFLARSCKLIQFFAIDFQGRVHWRNLFISADKVHHRALNVGFAHCHRRFRLYRTAQILSICRYAKPQDGLIFLALVCHQITELCRTAKTHRKNPDCVRVQCSCVSYFFLLYNAAEFRHNIMRGVASLLIDIHYSIDHSISSYSFI